MANENAILIKKNEPFTTMRQHSPLRFVLREGKKILQHPIECLDTGKIEWVDVPLITEDKP